MKTLLLSIPLLFSGFSLSAQTYGQKMVAAVLVAEAGVDGIDGMTAVAEVIRRRADKHGTTMLAEVKRSGQFAAVRQAGSVEVLYQKFYGSNVYKEALQIARLAYNTPEKLPGIANGATHFHRTNTLPYWVQGRMPVATVGSHNFYDIPGN
jgi:spore germination cell wall hydrolase CwlJ-like protein